MTMKNKGPSRAKKGTLGRLIKTLFEFYPVKMPIVLFCIIFSAVVSSIPAIFMQNVIAIVETSWKSGDWDAVSGKVFYYVGLLILYLVHFVRDHLYPDDGGNHAGIFEKASCKNVQWNAGSSSQIF